MSAAGSSDGQHRVRARALAPVVVAALVAALTVLAYRHFTRGLPPLDADETGHALPAARLADDLRRGDLRAFAADTQREMTWPFVHPWLLAGLFLATGPSTEAARASSLVTFGLAVVLAALLARELARETPSEETLGPDVWTGTVSALLMVLTADFWMHSSRVMIEPLGMLLTLGSLLAQARAARRRSEVDALAAGLLAALTFLTKYNYGLPLVAALALWLVIAGKDLRPTRRGTTLALLGLLVPIVAWLAYPFPEKLLGLYGFSVNRDEGLSGLADVFFYPLETARMISWPVTAGLLGALVLGLRHARTSVPTLFVLLSLAMLTVHPNKQVRYAFTFLPVLYVLAEVEWTRLVRRWLPSPGAAVLWPVVLVALAVSLDPRPTLEAETAHAENLRAAGPIMDFVVTRVRPDQRTLVLGSCGLLPHLLFQWEMTTRYGRVDPVVDNLPFPDEQPWDPRYRQGYPVEMTPAYDRRLQSALREGGYDRVVTLEIAADSVFIPDWLRRWDAWGQNYVALMEQQSLYPLSAEQAFPDGGVRVRLYAKP